MPTLTPDICIHAIVRHINTYPQGFCHVPPTSSQYQKMIPLLRKTYIACILSLLALAATAHPMYRVVNYDAYTKNLIDMRQIGQDRKGFIWVSTSDGLYRFDGYMFKGFKPQNCSGGALTSDAIEHMSSDRNGNLWCKIENKLFLFDTETYTFRNALEKVEKEKRYSVMMFRCLPDGTVCVVCEKGTVFVIDIDKPLTSARQIYHAGEDIMAVNHNNVTQEIWMRTRTKTSVISHGSVTLSEKTFEAPELNPVIHTDRFGKTWRRDEIDSPGIMKTYVTFDDNQDNVWYVYERQLYRISFYIKDYDRLTTEKSSIRCGMRDSKGRLWLSKRYENQVSIYDKGNNLLGYLTPQGKISSKVTDFTAKIYCMMEDSHGDIWLGSKPRGVFLLKDKGNGTYDVENYTRENSMLSDNEVIKIVEDNTGSIWACGFMQGLNKIERGKDAMEILPLTPEEYRRASATEMKFRDIMVTNEGALLASTSAGLLIYDTRKDIRNLRRGDGVRHIMRDMTREDGLNSSSIKTVIQSHDGKIYVCTHDKGIDLLTSESVFDDMLTFRHFCADNGFPSDYVKAIAEDGTTMWVTALNTLIEWNTAEQLPQAAKIRITLEGNDFSESSPVRRADGMWVYGVMDGCVTVDTRDIKKRKTNDMNYPIVITSVTDRDTLILASDERTLTMSFATLDYENTQHICYAVKFSGDEEGEWQYLGETHHISFQHLKPGLYTLSLRSTNGKGEWLDNERTITVKVTPTLYETWWWKALQAAGAILLIIISVRVWKYIKKIQKQQRETLDAYMQLLDHKKETNIREQEEYRMNLLQKAKVEPHNDQFIKLVMEYIEKNISSSDIDIDDMARYAAVSRSHLNHKLKHVLGVTPSEMIREARIKHACLLLHDYSKSINDIAYACGFADPKYFSKCFKATTGYSPSSYRLRL